MKKKRALILACVILAVSLAGVGCGKGSDKREDAVVRETTNSGGQSGHKASGTKKTEYKMEGRNLVVEGGDTFEVDEYIRLWEKAEEDRAAPEHITLSEDIKYVKPATEKEESELVAETAFSLSSLTLEGTSLTPDALFTVMNTFVWDRIFTRSGDGEPAKEYELTEENLGKFYKEYVSDLKEQDGMYIAEGILFFSEGKKKAVVIPDSVTAIGPCAFSAMSELAPELDSVVISDSVTLIGRKAFDMQSLKKIKLGKQVREIGEEAFNECDLKEDLVIPASVEKIGENAFGGDGEEDTHPGVKRIVIEGETEAYSRNFCSEKNITFKFMKGIQESFTVFTETGIVGEGEEGKKKQYEMEASWVPVEEADGYEIGVRVGGDYDEREDDEYALTKDVAGDQNKLKVKVPAPDDIEEYAYEVGAKITPYQMVDGKKVYGRSTKDVWELPESSSWPA